MNKVELLKKDPDTIQFLKENHLNDSFLKEHENALFRIFTSRKKCEGCKGLYCCGQGLVGQRLVLGYDEVLKEEVEYCDYQLEEMKANKETSSYVYSDVPEVYRKEDIHTMELLDEGQKNLCANLLSLFYHKREKGFYIYGDLGVGKTYECIAFANALVKNKEKVAFVKVNNFINELRNLVVNDNAHYEETIKKLKEVTYLFLDDIGAESVSSFSRDDVLFNILDYRMENKLCTIFTSNFSKEDLLKHYTFDKKDNSNLMRARRLLERIEILGEDFCLTGANKRR